MTNRDPIPPGAVLVALDIAKLRNEVLVEMPGQQRRVGEEEYIVWAGWNEVLSPREP